jgi:DNA-binding GntR family transcriptional regulator
MPPRKTLPELKTSTLRENIADVLTEAILSGRFRPGDRLNESELGRQMHVSRAPIREALHQLQEQGLVVNEPRRGMFVVNLTPPEIEKINRLRIVLEAEALLLCRRSLTPAAHKKLMQHLEKMEKSGLIPGWEAVRLDLTFHRSIWSQTGNEFLERVLSSLTAPLFAFARVRAPQKMKMILDSHRPLMEFVEGKHPEREARRIMHEHLTLRWGSIAMNSSDLR